MKKLFWIILFAGVFSMAEKSDAQLRKIPAKVTNNLHARYPDAKNIVWRDKITSCQASFDMDGIKYKVRFSRNGHWKSTEAYLSENSLPAVVKDGFRKSKYRNWRMRSSYIIYASGQNTKYHVRVAKGDLRQKELVFTSQGQLLADNIAI